MSSTKIINVLKDDSFKEILDIFKTTTAEEVIFVLPKSAKAFKKEDHFTALRAEAKSLGKTVSFLSSDSSLNELATKHKFDVLLARSPVPRKSAGPAKKNSINVVNQIEEFYSEPALDADSISTSKATEEPEEEEILPVAAPVKLNGRRLDDIYLPAADNHRSIKVSGAREKAIPLEVNQSIFDEGSREHPAEQELRNVWNSARPSEGFKGAVPTASLLSWFKRSRKSLSGLTPNRPTHRTGLMAVAGLAVVVLGTVIFVTTGNAKVTIKPTSEELNLDLTVFASDNTSSVNLATMAIPGQLFNIQKTVSRDFNATGHVDVAQKARGTITVYNEQVTDQPLIATTRFESADHHIFHTLTTITVPAGKTVNGKLVPGSKDVQVIADKAGSDYNVPIGLFTVPAFKEQGNTEKYQKVYGQSTAPILNGTSGQSTVVTESDLNTAKQTLTTQLTSNIQEELQSQINGLKIINDSQVVIGNPVSTSPTDAKATTFMVNLSGSLKTVGFKESDLNTLIGQYVDSKKDKTVLPDKLVLTYGNIHWDDAKNSLSFTVHVSGPGYAKIDQKKIITDLLGKNDADLRAYLSAVAGISSAHVSLSPFWVRSVPKSSDRVQVDVSY